VRRVSTLPGSREPRALDTSNQSRSISTWWSLRGAFIGSSQLPPVGAGALLDVFSAPCGDVFSVPSQASVT
jgi:hypothetical protein